MSMSYRLMSVNRKMFLKYKYFNNEVFFLKIAINLIILNSFIEKNSRDNKRLKVYTKNNILSCGNCGSIAWCAIHWHVYEMWLL